MVPDFSSLHPPQLAAVHAHNVQADEEKISDFRVHPESWPDSSARNRHTRVPVQTRG